MRQPPRSKKKEGKTSFSNEALNFSKMVVSFAHKGLKDFFERGDRKKINPNHTERIRVILARLNSAKDLRDMNYPGSNLHPLKKPPFKGFYSVNVSGNYRIIFRFENGDAYDVNYLDTH